MADINSNKNAIIIQPITLQIRAPFQFLTNRRAINHTHYSESRDGLNGRCSFSVVCVAREYTLGLRVHPVQGLQKLNRFHLFFTYISTSFSSQKSNRSLPPEPCIPSTVQISTAVGLWLRRRSRPFRFRRCF